MVQHRGHTIEHTLQGWVATVYLTSEGRFYMVKAETIPEVKSLIDSALEEDSRG